MVVSLKRKTKYKWWKSGKDKFDLIVCGEPDCFAYIIRYWSDHWKRAAWCWILNMPRGAFNEFCRGWASAPHVAKRQVEKAIEDGWK